LELAADSQVAAQGKDARYLPTSMLRWSRPKWGATRHEHRRRQSRREERRGLVEAVLMISRRQKTIYGGFCDKVRTPRPEGSTNGDHALPHHYPLSTCTPNSRECEQGSSRRLTPETRVLDGRAIGGWTVRPRYGFFRQVPGYRIEKNQIFDQDGRSTRSFCFVVLPPPPALKVTGDLD
jgi:hypothetical protein